MKHIKEYNQYDFIAMQAALHGLTREEWIAYYGTPQIGLGIEESKFVMTYEKYITYDKLGKWGTPTEIENDLGIQINNLFNYGGISDNLNDIIYTDQSSDKGIKWQIEVLGKGTDVIHAYKDGQYIGQYEWYLNKKKSSKYDIQQYFLNKYISKLDQYISSVKSFDVYYMMSDDNRAYKAGLNHANELIKQYSELSGTEKKKAHQAYIDSKKKNVDFKDFRGA